LSSTSNFKSSKQFLTEALGCPALASPKKSQFFFLWKAFHKNYEQSVDDALTRSKRRHVAFGMAGVMLTYAGVFAKTSRSSATVTAA
jgi:hypothetical protein